MLPEFGPEWFAGLGGVILTDLVLAGDNAVVIALAARNLPAEQRRRAVIFGAALAIVLRGVLTVLAVLLLREELPLIGLVGGGALLWIGWNLATQQDHGHDDVDAAGSMRDAIRTILVADVVMSIDNVLAVAAQGKDHLSLVVIGLLVSIPIIMGGASLLLRLIDRFPVIVWIGSVLVIYVGVELMLGDALVEDSLPGFLESTNSHRLVGLVIGVIVATIAWQLRTRGVVDASLPADAEAARTRVEESDATTVLGAADAAADDDSDSDGSNPRLMVDGPRSDD